MPSLSLRAPRGGSLTAGLRACALSCGIAAAALWTGTTTAQAQDAAAPAATEAAVPAGPQVVVRELENGLTVIVKENHVAPVAAFRIYVRAGSMYEQEWMGMGLTHVLEHLIAGGSTTTRSEDESEEIIDLLGGANNAYTTKDHTCYYIETNAGQVGTAIDLLADWLKNATVPEAEYKREMGVVMEELYKGQEEPGRIISQLFYETMFTTHPVRVPTIGYEEILKKITREDVMAYFHRMYVPNNIVVTCVGDFDSAVVTEQIATAFADFPRRPLPTLVLAEEPRQVAYRERTAYKDGLGGAYVYSGYHTVALQHEDLYPLDVLSYILSQGRSSRLVRSIREEQQLVSGIDTYSATPNYGAGIFGVTFTCPDDQVDAALAAIDVELERVKAEGVTEAELVKAKRQKLASEVFGSQTAEDEASGLAINYMGTGDVNFDKTYLAGIRAVTAADVQRVAREYLVRRNKTVAMLRPPAAAAAEQTATTATTDSPARMVTLPNGLRLLVKRNPNVPIVSVQTSFLGGLRLEPADKAGIARLTGAMLNRGAGDLTAQQIAEAFDGMGGSIGGASGNNTIYLSMSVLAEDFDEGMDYYAKVLLQPTFPADQFEILRGQTVDALARRRDDWQAELSLTFKERFFGDHPYARDTLGTEETVGTLTPADARAFYEATIVPERGVMAVFGDIDEDAVIAKLTAVFGSFKRPAPALPQLTPPAPMTEDTLVTIKAERRVSAVYIGYRGMTVQDDDRYAVDVLDGVVSGIGYPGGWLHNALRGGEQDLVYMVHAFNWKGLEPGYFGIMAASSPPKMDQVVQIILANMERARTELVTPEELTKAKAMCVTMEALSRQTNSDVGLQATLDELYGMGHDDAKQYAEKIQAVTAEDVQRVAQKYLTKQLTVRIGPEVEDSK